MSPVSASCVLLPPFSYAQGLQIPTMTSQLFPDADTQRIRPFSCGHIIPPSNVLGVVVQRGPRGGEMEFKFQSREDQALVRCFVVGPRSTVGF